MQTPGTSTLLSILAPLLAHFEHLKTLPSTLVSVFTQVDPLAKEIYLFLFQLMLRVKENSFPTMSKQVLCWVALCLLAAGESWALR